MTEKLKTILFPKDDEQACFPDIIFTLNMQVYDPISINPNDLSKNFLIAFLLENANSHYFLNTIGEIVFYQSQYNNYNKDVNNKEKSKCSFLLNGPNYSEFKTPPSLDKIIQQHFCLCNKQYMITFEEDVVFFNAFFSSFENDFNLKTTIHNLADDIQKSLNLITNTFVKVIYCKNNESYELLQSQKNKEMFDKLKSISLKYNIDKLISKNIKSKKTIKL